MRNDGELEKMVNDAIRGYSQVEPAPGLEQRILSVSLAEAHGRSRFAWQAVLAIPTLAYLVILLFLMGRKYLPLSTLPPAALPAVASSSAAIPLAPALKGRRISGTQPHPTPKQVVRRSPPLPEEDVFPSPTPLTVEERAMIALAQNEAPIPSQPVAVGEAEVSIPDVHIAELEIQPVLTLPEQKPGPTLTLPVLISQQP